jgi:two-component system OmpR family sensor kinase
VRSVSITRRLTLTVLALEVFSAIALIGAITVNERHTELKAFDATLRGTADSIMGAVQDADNETGDVMLDLRGVQIGKDAVFRVEDERGKVIGAVGNVPEQVTSPVSSQSAFQNVQVLGRNYRFIIRHGIRILDPGEASGGIRRTITIIYGAPDHVWHEVLEAIRFFAIATAILLGITALGMVWLLRRVLSPLHELAQQAERITAKTWQFESPASAQKTEELRPLAQALEAALARLQRSFEQQRRFTSDAAHELKTDVAIVKSSLQLLSMRKRTVEEYSRGLALSLDDFTRLEMTVQTMLTLARLEQPRELHGGDAARRVCSLRDVVEEAVHQSRALAELKNVNIRTKIGADLQVPIDRRDALLLCSNILLNALQHSPPQSSVLVEVITEGEQVRLTVKDEGEGIVNEDRPYLFEPFYRGDPSRSRKSGGTGLGLSICKAICERAGGSIQISNNSAAGALVTIVLPLDEVFEIASE